MRAHAACCCTHTHRHGITKVTLTYTMRTVESMNQSRKWRIKEKNRQNFVVTEFDEKVRKIRGRW